MYVQQLYELAPGYPVPVDITDKLTSLAEALVDSATTALEPNGPGMPAGDTETAKEAIQGLVLVLAELRRDGGGKDPDAETAEDAEFRKVLQKAGIDVADL
jgi:hypothetical protein